MLLRNPKRLVHVTGTGRIRQWKTHKLQSLATAKAMATLDDDKHSRRAERMRHCAAQLEFTREEGELRLRTGNRCKVRHCAVCQASKSREDYAVLMYRVREHAKLFPRALPIMLTLTVPRVPPDRLRGEISALLKAFRSLTRKTIVTRSVLGWHRSLEVTFNNERTAHPHLHVLLFVRDGYFANDSPLYLTQRDWTALWADVTGVPRPIVHVKRIGRDVAGELVLDNDGLYELTKYVVKPFGWYALDDGRWSVDADLLAHLHEAVHGRRLRDVGGTLRKIKKPAKPDRPTDEELEAAHTQIELFAFGDWLDVHGELHGPDYWQRAPPKLADLDDSPTVPSP